MLPNNPVPSAPKAILTLDQIAVSAIAPIDFNDFNVAVVWGTQALAFALLTSQLLEERPPNQDETAQAGWRCSVAVQSLTRTIMHQHFIAPESFTMRKFMQIYVPAIVTLAADPSTIPPPPTTPPRPTPTIRHFLQQQELTDRSWRSSPTRFNLS